MILSQAMEHNEKYPRIAGFNPESIADGTGMRAVIFLSGCSHHCPQCQNPEAQDPSFGLECTEDMIIHLLTEIKMRPFLSGLTLSGGDPFYCPAKTLALLQVIQPALRNVKGDGFNYWVYTGYTAEELQAMAKDDPAVAELIDMVDTIVDGRFVPALADKRLAFRGSSNQRILQARPLLDGHIVNEKPSRRKRN